MDHGRSFRQLAHHVGHRDARLEGELSGLQLAGLARHPGAKSQKVHQSLRRDDALLHESGRDGAEIVAGLDHDRRFLLKRAGRFVLRLAKVQDAANDQRAEHEGGDEEVHERDGKAARRSRAAARRITIQKGLLLPSLLSARGDRRMRRHSSRRRCPRRSRGVRSCLTHLAVQLGCERRCPRLIVGARQIAAEIAFAIGTGLPTGGSTFRSVRFELGVTHATVPWSLRVAVTVLPQIVWQKTELA